ncbi:MAG: hypothetical protein RJA29_2146, partial [Pseudomonadota bacterium]
VLVVDDILANVRLLEAKLAAEYFEVVTAMNGADALEAVQRTRPDIVLLDVMMPGIDGIEVCRRIKQNQVAIAQCEQNLCRALMLIIIIEVRICLAVLSSARDFFANLIFKEGVHRLAYVMICILQFPTGSIEIGDRHLCSES